MLELNDNVETYLEWCDRMAAFYESHDEFGVSIIPSECYGWTVDCEDDDDIDLPDYF